MASAHAAPFTLPSSRMPLSLWSNASGVASAFDPQPPTTSLRDHLLKRTGRKDEATSLRFPLHFGSGGALLGLTRDGSPEARAAALSDGLQRSCHRSALGT